jgi:hypothetical protein
MAETVPLRGTLRVHSHRVFEAERGRRVDLMQRWLSAAKGSGVGFKVVVGKSGVEDNGSVKASKGRVGRRTRETKTRRSILRTRLAHVFQVLGS